MGRRAKTMLLNSACIITIVMCVLIPIIIMTGSGDDQIDDNQAVTTAATTTCTTYVSTTKTVPATTITTTTSTYVTSTTTTTATTTTVRCTTTKETTTKNTTAMSHTERITTSQQTTTNHSGTEQLPQSHSTGAVINFSRGTFYNAPSGAKGGSQRKLIDCSVGNGTVKGSVASWRLYREYGYKYNGSRTMLYIEVDGYSQMNGYYYLDDCSASKNYYAGGKLVDANSVIDFFYVNGRKCPFYGQGVVRVKCYVVT